MVSHGVFAGGCVRNTQAEDVVCKGSEEVKVFVLTSVVMLSLRGLHRSNSHLCRASPIFCSSICEAGQAKKTKAKIFIEIMHLIIQVNKEFSYLSYMIKNQNMITSIM